MALEEVKSGPRKNPDQTNIAAMGTECYGKQACKLLCSPRRALATLPNWCQKIVLQKVTLFDSQVGALAVCSHLLTAKNGLK